VAEEKKVNGKLLIVEAGKFLIAVDVTDKNTSEPAAVKSEADAPPFLF
jgi:hypothetical protein